MATKTKTKPTLSFSSLGPKPKAAAPVEVLVKAPAAKTKVKAVAPVAPEVQAAPAPVAMEKEKVKQFIIRWPTRQHYAIKALAAESGLKSMQVLVQTALTEYKLKLAKDAENAALGIAPVAPPAPKKEADSLDDVLTGTIGVRQFIIRWSETQHYEIKALTASLKLKSMQEFIQLALAEYKRKRSMR